MIELLELSSPRLSPLSAAARCAVHLSGMALDSSRVSGIARPRELYVGFGGVGRTAFEGRQACRR